MMLRAGSMLPMEPLIGDGVDGVHCRSRRSSVRAPVCERAGCHVHPFVCGRRVPLPVGAAK